MAHSVAPTTTTRDFFLSPVLRSQATASVNGPLGSLGSGRGLIFVCPLASGLDMVSALVRMIGVTITPVGEGVMLSTVRASGNETAPRLRLTSWVSNFDIRTCLDM